MEDPSTGDLMRDRDASLVHHDDVVDAGLSDLTIEVPQQLDAFDAALLLQRIGCAEIERLTCSSDALGTIDFIQPRNETAWSVEFPSLESLPKPQGETKRLRICIATEDIVGPVRNGGIGTTYAYLSELLAKTGHDSCILYLRGQECENGTIEEWVSYYAAKGVEFIPVPNYAVADRFQTGANRWLEAPYNMLRYLLDHPMDVVHVSEWHGSGYLSLLAKKQRLAFARTLFIVKTSSPWLWNRLYGSQPLDRLEDLAKIYAERQSVELADMVIGGSLHLLRWMSSQGYRIPHDRTYVQPNLAFFGHLKALSARRANALGTRMAVEEIVFFGRLEARKGLFVFCQAIKRLIRDGGPLPKTISFMGKPGARLTARPDRDVVDYIMGETATWPCKVNLLTDFQQFQALDYLLSEQRLAVMPSIIENSSMAVYEAAICGIPFIASNSGGTPELVHSDDRAIVLCEAHPVTLAERLTDALANGAYVARPSFDNDENVEIWTRFHEDLGRGLLDSLLEPPVTESAASDLAFSVCIYHTGNAEALATSFAAIREQELQPREVLIAVDAEDSSVIEIVRRECATLNLPFKVFETFDYDAGLAFNVAAREATGEFLFFMWSGTVLNTQALRALSKVARSAGSDLLNFFYRVTFKDNSSQRDYLNATILGSVSESFFRTDLTSLPFAVRTDAFRLVDGFSSDYRVLGCEMEFVARSQVLGLKCTTALLELGSVAGLEDEWVRERCYDLPTSYFRLIRPQMAAVPLALRDLLLASKGLQLRPARAGRGPGPGKAKPKPIVAEPKTAFGQLFRALSNDVMTGSVGSAADKPVPREPAPRAAPKPSVKKPSDVPALINLIDEVDVDIGGKPRKGGRPEPRSETISSALKKQLFRIGEERGALYTGRLLAVRNGIITGWVRDDARPDTHVDVHVFEGGRRIATITAKQTLDTAIALAPELRGHGFTTDIGTSWLATKLRRKPRNIRLGVGADGDILLAELAVGTTSLAAAGLEGYCEPGKAGRLNGWVWRPAEPERRFDVSVFVDGKFFVRTTATTHRDDLAQANIGDGDHAFVVPIPKMLRDGTRRTVEVFVADEGILLNRGTVTLEGDTFTIVGIVLCAC